MPTNKYASAYLNAAYQRMLAAVTDMEPPTFDVFPMSAQFDDAAAHLKDKWVSAIDDYIRALAIEARSNSTRPISAPTTLLSDALHDSGLIGELEHEAYELREQAMEPAQ